MLCSFYRTRVQQKQRVAAAPRNNSPSNWGLGLRVYAGGEEEQCGGGDGGIGGGGDGRG